MSKKAACQIRKLSEADLPAAAALEKQAFPDAWSTESLKETCRQKTSLILGAWRETELAGYVLFTRIPPEGEILRIAVDESLRRQGVAGQLLEALEKECKKSGITRVMLEVRAGNTPAVRLYEQNGFKVDGVRKSYYQAPAEDALLMSRQL